jgi:hypothetical protein
MKIYVVSRCFVEKDVCGSKAVQAFTTRQLAEEFSRDDEEWYYIEECELSGVDAPSHE